MNKAILDTDILSEVLKNRNPQVAIAADKYRAVFGRLTFSSISVMEVVKGLHKANQTKRLELFLQSLALEEVLLFGSVAAEIAGRIAADLERSGQTIGRADPMIAGIAINQGLVLVTANTDHFQRIRDLGYQLEIENWRDAQPRV
jgi:tRNA(fMet)-specific endonuclease VapC